MTPEYREARIEHSLRYLEEVRDLAVRHRATDAYIRSLYEDAQGIGGIDYSKDVVSKSPSPDAIPNSVALLIEMKTPKGVLSQLQRIWRDHITKDGYKHVVCRSVQDFINEVENYLNEDQ